MYRAVALLLLVPAHLTAQMTVEGRVADATGAPVTGASIQIRALDISVRTTAEGRYNFIIRQALVRGQTVEMTARHSRFGSQTILLPITGGAVVRDFVLGGPRIVRDRRPPDSSGIAPASGSPTLASTPGREIPFDDAGASDVSSALAGQFAPLQIVGSNSAGGSAFMNYRGIRSLSGSSQPLVVVDGVPIDNHGFTTLSQRFGLGGFDYGSPLQDIAPGDIASISLLDGAAASLEYGARAANGVIVVTTRDGRGISGLQFTVTPRFTASQVTRLPDYQDRFGQGLGGAFEFFDGRGGGINDEIAQSWGPRLDGSPIPQHSLTEVGRPDVRYWLPRPDGVRGYFDDARDADVSVALLGSQGSSHFRAALGVRDAAGPTPEASVRRLSGTFSGGTAISDRLTADGNVRLIRANASQRPGTGFDEVNPMAGFTRFGRQVDIEALRNNVVDDDGSQINWIYTARNNPFFATSLNANEDERTQVIAAATISYALTRSVTSMVRAGVADYSESRDVTVARGWLGGFPSSLGRADFGGGGIDRSAFSAGERFVSAVLTARHVPWQATELVSRVSAGIRANDFDTRMSVTDAPVTGAATVTNLSRTGRDDARSADVSVAAIRHGNLAITAGTRFEQLEVAARSFGEWFPSLAVSYDLARRPGVRERFRLGQARLNAQLWRAGNAVGSRSLTGMYFGGGLPISPVDDVTGAERLSGIQLSGAIQSLGGRVALELIGYRERSRNLIVATAAGDGSAVLSQTGQIFNGGYEAIARLNALAGDILSWDITGSFARNVNTVDALQPGVFQTFLSPEAFGARSAARIGASSGIIVGSRYLRTADGALVLRDGVPIRDANAPFTILGSTQPDWTAAFRNRLRYRGVELAALVDARVGGHVFSATNLWGSYAGTLESTLIGDRRVDGIPATTDSLLIAGVDSVTGQPNTTRVSAEEYFHALGEITEPWVYAAGAVRLRMLRIGYEVRAGSIPGLREHAVTLSLIGRNVAGWYKAPNIQPDVAISSQAFHGFEMGQLPGVRSWTLHVSVAP